MKNENNLTRLGYSIDSISQFIHKYNDQFDGSLDRIIGYPRVVALHDFDHIIRKLNLSKQEHVGIFSGSLSEPELKLIEAKKITLLNFEENDEYDLDTTWLSQEPHNFSLALCNQVLEHIFSPQTALKNIIHHTRPGGYIFISIPTINCIHSEPHFYSSGFHPRYLERLARELNLIPIMINHWGSFKYMVNAVSGRWLSEKNLKIGVHGVRDLIIPFSIFQDGRKISERYITDCWGLFQKPLIAS
jgi:SAM-dependent methyltransferase